MGLIPFSGSPGNDEGLEALVQPSDKFADGILNKMPRDPWGHAYQYNQPGHSGPFDIVSYGADGHEGGEGADRDITNEDVDAVSN